MKPKSHKILLFILAGAFAAFIGIYFRLYPVLFPSSAESEEKAMILVTARLRADIVNQIERTFPGLSGQEKVLVADGRYRQALVEQKNNIQKTVQRLSQEIYGQIAQERFAQGEQPEIYLIGSDGYYFYGLTHDIAQGKPVMAKRQGTKYFNEMMLAPLGYWEAINFHPYVGYGVFKIIQLFDANASLMFGVSFTSIFIIVFCSIFFLLICASLGMNPVPSAMALLFFLTPHILLRRTFFGWYDTDPYILLFSLIAVWLFILGIENRANPKKSLGLGLACAICLVIYAFFWQGWVYLFSVLLSSAVAIILFSILIVRDRPKAKQCNIFFTSLFGLTFLGSLLSFGLSGFLSLFSEGLSVLQDFLAPQLSAWPDIYISVGELHKADLKKFLELVGGILFLFIGFGGVAYSIRLFTKNTKKDIALKLIVLFVFFLSSFLIAIKVQRFILLFIIPLSIFCAFGFEWLYGSVKNLIGKVFSKKPYQAAVQIIGVAVVSIVFSLSPILRAHDLAPRLRPIFDETWDAALSQIQKATPENSIINTWWPPGHFIKAVAQRRVISDGATINVPQAYWMARALLSQDEQKAAGILRMLNASANQATEYLESLGFQSSEAAALIETIATLSKENAKSRLTQRLSAVETDTVLSLTHAHPAPAYVFLYDDLIKQHVALGLAGNWDIAQMEKINQVPRARNKIRTMDTLEYIHFLWDLQGGMPRVSETLPEIGRDGAIILFDQGITFNLEQKTSRVSSPKFGQGIPQSIVFIEADAIREKKLAGASLKYSILFFQENLSHPSMPYNAIVMDTALANSLLMKLYYLKGQGLKYFKPFDMQRSVGNRTILYTFEIDWQRYQQDLGD